ncbi:type II secretion system F family protein [Acidobacteriota bacterium]
MAGTKKSTSLLWLVGRQLASMLRSGLPLSQSLTMIGKDMGRSDWAKILDNLGKRVEDGETLSEAILRHHMVEPDESLAVLKAGERSGELPSALEEVARYADLLYDLRDRARSLMIYPFVVALLALVVAVYMVKAYPTFKNLYETVDLKASWPLRLLAALGENASMILVAMFIVCIVLFILRKSLFRRLGRTLPFARSFYLANERARFLKATSMCIKAGMTVPEALQAALPSLGDAVFRTSLEKVIGQVKEGGSIGDSFDGSRVFPHAVLWVLRQAERHGELPACLDNLAESYDRRAEISGRAYLSLLEPLTIAVVGFLVAVVVYSIMAPMFHLIGAIHP